MSISIAGMLKRVAICSLLAASSAHAGVAQGKIGQLVVGHGGHKVFIEILGTVSGFPCATSHPNGFRYALSTDNPGGKEMLATLLAARAGDQNIQIVGNASCTLATNMEDVSYVWLY